MILFEEDCAELAQTFEEMPSLKTKRRFFSKFYREQIALKTSLSTIKKFLLSFSKILSRKFWLERNTLELKKSTTK